jgi:hypothetical protein
MNGQVEIFSGRECTILQQIGGNVRVRRGLKGDRVAYV